MVLTRRPVYIIAMVGFLKTGSGLQRTTAFPLGVCTRVYMLAPFIVISVPPRWQHEHILVLLSYSIHTTPHASDRVPLQPPHKDRPTLKDMSGFSDLYREQSLLLPQEDAGHRIVKKFKACHAGS